MQYRSYGFLGSQDSTSRRYFWITPGFPKNHVPTLCQPKTYNHLKPTVYWQVSRPRVSKQSGAFTWTANRRALVVRTPTKRTPSVWKQAVEGAGRLRCTDWNFRKLPWSPTACNSLFYWIYFLSKRDPTEQWATTSGSIGLLCWRVVGSELLASCVFAFSSAFRRPTSYRLCHGW